MKYEDRGSSTFLKNLGDGLFSQLKWNLIKTLPSGTSITCWIFFWAMFFGDLVFWIINSWGIVISFHFNNFRVKLVTLSDSALYTTVSSKLGSQTHLGLS